MIIYYSYNCEAITALTDTGLLGSLLVPSRAYPVLFMEFRPARPAK